MAYAPHLSLTSSLFFLLCMSLTAASGHPAETKEGPSQSTIWTQGAKNTADAFSLERQALNNPGILSFYLSTIPDTGGPEQGDEFALLVRQWNELYSNILKEEKEVQNTFRSATNAQFKASEKLRTAELNPKLIEPDHLASLHEEYENAVANLKKAKSQQKEIKTLVEKSRKINFKQADLSEKKVASIRSAYNVFLAKYTPGRSAIIDPLASTPTPAAPAKQDKKQKPEKPIDPVEPGSPAYDPAMINKRPTQTSSAYTTQPFECLYAVDSTDNMTGTRRLDLKPGLFFSHTDPDLRPFFKDKDLISCLGALSRIGPYVYLRVEFQIASSHAQSNFGALAEGSLLRFKLMNGEYVSLYNLKTNSGRIDPYSGYTVFSGQYALGKNEIKKLGADELDKMRVLWSTGYEDYDIYNIEFLINQLNCLMSKK